MKYQIVVEGQVHELELAREGAGWRGRLDGEPLLLDAVIARPDVMSVIIAGTAYEVKRERWHAGDVHFWVKDSRFAVEVRDPRSLRSRRAAAGLGEGPQKVMAPMPGKVVRVLAPPGSAVEAGDGIVVIEAMKMQNELKSPKKGVVRHVSAAEGATVNAGEVLAIVE